MEMNIAELSSPAVGNSIAVSTIGTLLANVMGYMPLVTGTLAAIGVVLGIIWYSIMIAESHTVKDWRKHRRHVRRLRRVIRVKAELQMLQRELSDPEVQALLQKADDPGESEQDPGPSDLM